MEQIHALRRTIDILILTVDIVIDASREVALAHTNLQRGKMWLGKVLQALGTPNPYPNSVDSANSVIDVQTDNPGKTLEDEFTGMGILGDQVKMVKELRNRIQMQVDEMKRMEAAGFATVEADRYWLQSRLAMEEAKMWLGWELDRIRNLPG